MTRSDGTESLKAAILSLRFVRYRFSIMLWAVFLTGGWRPLVGGGLSSSSSSSTLDFLFLLSGSGDEVDDGDAGYCCCFGMAISRSLDSSCGERTLLYVCPRLLPGAGLDHARGVE